MVTGRGNGFARVRHALLMCRVKSVEKTWRGEGGLLFESAIVDFYLMCRSRRLLLVSLENKIFPVTKLMYEYS